MKENVTNYLSNEYLHGNNIFFVLSAIEKEYPLHFHEFYEIELCYEGEGYEVINGNKYPISPNKIFLLHPTDYHQIVATKPLKMFNVAFTNSLIDEENITYFLDYQNEIVLNLSSVIVLITLYVISNACSYETPTSTKEYTIFHALKSSRPSYLFENIFSLL